jgi:hypothetical protein
MFGWPFEWPNTRQIALNSIKLIFHHLQNQTHTKTIQKYESVNLPEWS